MSPSNKNGSWRARIRDLPVPRTLMDNFGHADCGIYAEVIAGGDIALGDTLENGRLL